MMEEKRNILSVAELNRKARLTLENRIGDVWVAGEISNFKNSSGIWYFTLKDAQAEISATMFSQYNRQVPFRAEDGAAVRAYGTVGIFEKRGTYQIRVSNLEQAGKGSLHEQFEKLKAKLAAEGLFDEDRKRPLPMIPRKIGIVTAPTGQAIRDMIDSLTTRFPNLHILLAPVRVQGATAASSIANAIHYFNTRSDIDVMIVGRGGGSLEDLWAFNEEVVARAIAGSTIPVVSAVGHQGDVLISDYVADARASTPTKAAELVVPTQKKLIKEVQQLNVRLRGSLLNKSQRYKDRIPALNRGLQRAIIGWKEQKQQQADEAARRLAHELKNSVTIRKQRLPAVEQAMFRCLQAAAASGMQDVKRLEAQLRTLNPLSVLDRGYSLTETADGVVVRDASSVKPGERLKIRVAKGQIISEVKENGYDGETDRL